MFALDHSGNTVQGRFCNAKCVAKCGYWTVVLFRTGNLQFCLHLFISYQCVLIIQGGARNAIPFYHPINIVTS